MARFPDQFQLQDGVWTSVQATPTAYSDGETAENTILNILKNEKDLGSLSQEVEGTYKILKSWLLTGCKDGLP